MNFKITKLKKHCVINDFGTTKIKRNSGYRWSIVCYVFTQHF